MSRIYEAIQSAREMRSVKGLDSSDRLGEMELPTVHLDSKGELDIELTVYGRSESEAPFYDRAKAIGAYANGGRLLLAVPVTEGQDLLLINTRTSQLQICNVISVRVLDIRQCEVYVSFPSPNPDFWKTSKKRRSRPQ
jgi:hypothetical protein